MIDLSKSFNPVPKPTKKVKEKVTKIKKKSSKLAKLERQRDKGLKKSGKCDKCHMVFEHLDSHEIFGGSNRKRSMLNDFVILLCRKCHRELTDNPDKQKKLQVKTQKEFEKTHSREEYIKIIGILFIKNTKVKIIFLI